MHVNVNRILKIILPIKLQIASRNIRVNLINICITIFAFYKRSRTVALIATLKPLKDKNSPQYIVSLTSYGKRLTLTAPHAIATLINQSIKPDKVILWVANEDKENIPKIMENLTEKGLEVRFCEDIRSYKKLVPALEHFPNDFVVTADDDIFYPYDWFEQLIVEHNKNPKKIICHRAHGIRVDENYDPIPYANWDFCIEPEIHSEATDESYHQWGSVFPTGCGGILYPPNCFYEDITNKALFMKLAPYADDIWFWAMAMMNKKYFGEESPYIILANGYSKKLSIVRPEEEKSANALLNYNLMQNGNDKQLKAVIGYYPQIKSSLKKSTI